jgi:hypothetical protein
LNGFFIDHLFDYRLEIILGVAIVSRNAAK